MKILHLTVTRHWFDKIDSGEKTVEYREIKEYWKKRLLRNDRPIVFDYIVIKNGYKKNSPTIKKIWKRTFVASCGDLGNFPQFAISLGETIC